MLLYQVRQVFKYLGSGTSLPACSSCFVCSSACAFLCSVRLFPVSLSLSPSSDLLRRFQPEIDAFLQFLVFRYSILLDIPTPGE